MQILKEMRKYTGDLNTDEDSKFFYVLPNNKWKMAWDIMIML